MENSKYYFQCNKCSTNLGDFSDWFASKQKCSHCGSSEADVLYYKDPKEIVSLVNDKNFHPSSIWGYFDFLPLNHKKNIITSGEGIVPIDHWTFIEKFAKDNYNINCKIYAHRHDNNFSTGTFKDLAGSMVASVLTEHQIKNYVVASTGNIAVAFSRYLGSAGISVFAFIPQISIQLQEAEIGLFGQKVFRVNGDYAKAKHIAKEFAEKHNILLAAGNFDPMRIEAKKTMVYEWLRVLPEYPTVYFQALSGGSGPLGIAKACRELKGLGVAEKMPRFILAQPHNCAPMAHAWHEAKVNCFPDGWETKYPVYDNPETDIQTLSTGNPTAYPSLSKIVHQSEGEIIEVYEPKTIDVSRLVAYEVGVKIGPAAAIAVGGFFKSLRQGLIKNGDVVMLNIGEGMRRCPDFMEKLVYTTQHVNSVDECTFTDRSVYHKQLWENVAEI